MKKIGVIGEDKRSRYLKKILEEENMYSSVIDSEYIYYPIPFKNLKNALENKKTVISGKIIKEDRKVLEENNIKYIDLLESENFILENAKVTAESSIIPLINQTERRIENEKILVLGYGRIAKHLLKILKGFNPLLRCFARKEKYKEEMEKENIEYVYYKDIEEKLLDTTVVVNTVPENIVTKEMLKILENKNILYIELASKPYGIDINNLTYYDINFLLLNALPSKVMAKDAANLIKKEIDITLKK